MVRRSEAMTIEAVETDGSIDKAYNTSKLYKYNRAGKYDIPLQLMSKEEINLNRRKAYDVHLKNDIKYRGRGGSMNKTYDPFYHPDWTAAEWQMH